MSGFIGSVGEVRESIEVEEVWKEEKVWRGCKYALWLFVNVLVGVEAVRLRDSADFGVQMSNGLRAGNGRVLNGRRREICRESVRRVEKGL